MTPSMLRVLAAVDSVCAAQPWGPSLDEVAAAARLRSKGAVSRTLDRLRAVGLVTWLPRRPRSLRPLGTRVYAMRGERLVLVEARPC